MPQPPSSLPCHRPTCNTSTSSLISLAANLPLVACGLCFIWLQLAIRRSAACVRPTSNFPYSQSPIYHPSFPACCPSYCQPPLGLQPLSACIPPLPDCSLPLGLLSSPVGLPPFQPACRPLTPDCPAAYSTLRPYSLISHRRLAPSTCSEPSTPASLFRPPTNLSILRVASPTTCKPRPTDVHVPSCPHNPPPLLPSLSSIPRSPPPRPTIHFLHLSSLPCCCPARPSDHNHFVSSLHPYHLRLQCRRFVKCSSPIQRLHRLLRPRLRLLFILFINYYIYRTFREDCSRSTYD